MKKQINNTHIPEHVAIIMDGNGRWAQQHGEDRSVGHSSGVESVREVVKTACEIGIKYLTIYAFSTENWGRPQKEVDCIMTLLSATILSEAKPLGQAGVRLKFIGELDKLPEDLQQSMKQASSIEIDHIKLELVIALNYSSRQEITLATQKIARMVECGEITSNQIDQQLVSNNLMTNFMPDPDLMIRTSGEVRLSNFLLWQLSYSELYFTDVLWPDFNGKEFMKAIKQYEHRNRRFGLVK